VSDEGPDGGFETAPERRRGRTLPALIALATLDTLGAVLGVAVSTGDGGGGAASPPDAHDRSVEDFARRLREALRLVLPASGIERPKPAIAIPTTRAVPCVNDETQTCQNLLLLFSRNIPLEQRETAIRRGLRSLGYRYEGPFEPAAPNATGGAGLLFRQDPEEPLHEGEGGPKSVAIYLQPDAVTNECPALDPSCADIMSVPSRRDPANP
jgi:hypothetical protein